MGVHVKEKNGQCQNKSNMNLLHRNIILSQPGKNLFRWHVEDHDDFDYNDSVWQIVAEPIQ